MKGVLRFHLIMHRLVARHYSMQRSSPASCRDMLNIPKNNESLKIQRRTEAVNFSHLVPTPQQHQTFQHKLRWNLSNEAAQPWLMTWPHTRSFFTIFPALYTIVTRKKSHSSFDYTIVEGNFSKKNKKKALALRSRAISNVGHR